MFFLDKYLYFHTITSPLFFALFLFSKKNLRKDFWEYITLYILYILFSEFVMSRYVTPKICALLDMLAEKEKTFLIVLIGYILAMFLGSFVLTFGSFWFYSSIINYFFFCMVMLSVCPPLGCFFSSILLIVEFIIRFDPLHRNYY